MKFKNVFPSFWLVRSYVHECSFPVTSHHMAMRGRKRFWRRIRKCREWIFSSFLFVEARSWQFIICESLLLGTHVATVSGGGHAVCKPACPVFIVLLRKKVCWFSRNWSHRQTTFLCVTQHKQPSTRSRLQKNAGTVSWAGEDDHRTWKETVILSDLVSCADLFLRTH